MLLQESRRAARTSPAGELILLENQDRSLWNREQIAEGVAVDFRIPERLSDNRTMCCGSLSQWSCDPMSQESHYWRQRYATPKNRYRRQS